MDFKGVVRVHKLNGTSWLQLGQNFTGDASGDSLGSSVALSSDGTTVSMDTDPVLFT